VRISIERQTIEACPSLSDTIFGFTPSDKSKVAVVPQIVESDLGQPFAFGFMSEGIFYFLSSARFLQAMAARPYAASPKPSLKQSQPRMPGIGLDTAARYNIYSKFAPNSKTYCIFCSMQFKIAVK